MVRWAEPLLVQRAQEKMAVADAQGRVTTFDVYRCDQPNCGKLFQTRGALATHQGWHKRQPKAGQSMSWNKPNPGGRPMVEAPRKRVRREGAQPPQALRWHLLLTLRNRVQISPAVL